MEIFLSAIREPKDGFRELDADDQDVSTSAHSQYATLLPTHLDGKALATDYPS
jgi:hypothetical protein